MTQYIYLVEDTQDCPGRILALFASYDDAYAFSKAYPDRCRIEERKLWYGQVGSPPASGKRF